MLEWTLSLIIFYLIYKLFTAILTFLDIKAKVSSIPGPNLQHLYGDLKLFTGQKGSLSENFLNTFKSISKLYKNDGIFKLRFGNKFIVCVFKPLYLKEILASRENISKSIEYSFLNDWIGDGLLLANKHDWPKQRSMLTKAFHNESIKQLIPLINNSIDHFLSRLPSKNQFEYPTKESFKFTVQLISETLFSYKLNDNATCDYLQSVYYLTKTFTTRALNPLFWVNWIFKLTNTGKQYAYHLQVLRDITHKIISKRNSTTAKTNDMMEILLNKLNYSVESRKIMNEIDTFLFAGHDTTALTINWILYHLGLYAEEQQKVRKEIISIVGLAGVIEQSHLDKMVYLDCFIRECLRLYPPVPLIGRTVSQNIQLSSGHTIPKDTVLYVLLDQLHLDPSIYVNPHQFKPDRFLQDIQPFSYLPFSGGPRNCIGKRFALIVIKILIVKLLLNFTISADQPYDSIELTFDIVLKPKYPLNIKFTANNNK